MWWDMGCSQSQTAARRGGKAWAMVRTQWFLIRKLLGVHPRAGILVHKAGLGPARRFTHSKWVADS